MELAGIGAIYFVLAIRGLQHRLWSDSLSLVKNDMGIGMRVLPGHVLGF
jgi:hypothetical protein